jgi:hypothetical protein
MITSVLIAAAVVVCTVLASCFMWWATRRSAIWAMAAGALLAFIALAGALAIGWLVTRASYGP